MKLIQELKIASQGMAVAFVFIGGLDFIFSPRDNLQTVRWLTNGLQFLAIAGGCVILTLLCTIFEKYAKRFRFRSQQASLLQQRACNCARTRQWLAAEWSARTGIPQHLA